MASLYRLEQFRKTAKKTFFDRSELNQLLSLYSRRVASGEWRDYAIDQLGATAVFSVFRHSHETPLFRITKQAKPGHHGGDLGGEYGVFSGREQLSRAKSLPEALKIFNQKIRIVS